MASQSSGGILRILMSPAGTMAKRSAKELGTKVFYLCYASLLIIEIIVLY